MKIILKIINILVYYHPAFQAIYKFTIHSIHCSRCQFLMKQNWKSPCLCVHVLLPIFTLKFTLLLVRGYHQNFALFFDSVLAIRVPVQCLTWCPEYAWVVTGRQYYTSLSCLCLIRNREEINNTTWASGVIAYSLTYVIMNLLQN